MFNGLRKGTGSEALRPNKPLLDKTRKGSGKATLNPKNPQKTNGWTPFQIPIVEKNILGPNRVSFPKYKLDSKRYVSNKVQDGVQSNILKDWFPEGRACRAGQVFCCCRFNLKGKEDLKRTRNDV